MNYNTYYVSRHNKIVEVDITDISFGEVFFYIGKNSDSIHDVFYVFAKKGKVTNHIMEIEQNAVSKGFYTKSLLIKKFKTLNKIKSYV